MLSLLADERTLLHSLGALALDSDGQEILTGLTLAESNYLIGFRTKLNTANELAEWRLFNQILRTHLRATLATPHRRDGYLARIGIIGFHEGDVVRLKGGGPTADVLGIIDDYCFEDGPEVGLFCVWENAGHRFEQVFPCAQSNLCGWRPSAFGRSSQPTRLKTSQLIRE